MSLFRLIFGLAMIAMTAMTVWTGVPRAWTEFRHSREFVPATDIVVASYKCTNWNFVMFNECKITYVPVQAGRGSSGELHDYRFGPAPTAPIHLLQEVADPAVVTTDVSLSTLANRALALLSILVFGVVMAAGIIIISLGIPQRAARPARALAARPSSSAAISAERLARVMRDGSERS